MWRVWSWCTNKEVSPFLLLLNQFNSNFKSICLWVGRKFSVSYSWVSFLLDWGSAVSMVLPSTQALEETLVISHLCSSVAPKPPITLASIPKLPFLSEVFLLLRRCQSRVQAPEVLGNYKSLLSRQFEAFLLFFPLSKNWSPPGRVSSVALLQKRERNVQGN